MGTLNVSDIRAMMFRYARIGALATLGAPPDVLVLLLHYVSIRGHNRISSPGRSVTDASHRKTRLPLVYCFYEPTDAYKNNRLV
ncbi:jg6977 [Pararge aegeria aegeria]|uniref:Jg6977 protein n=1 Tax=Pararge aegeria aegeria TaxID=348720 RepID=A0A8S4SIR0_9NEOP|nr:jg6977 [Pararge aegeria aegeria]